MTNLQRRQRVRQKLGFEEVYGVLGSEDGYLYDKDGSGKVYVRYITSSGALKETLVPGPIPDGIPKDEALNKHVVLRYDSKLRLRFSRLDTEGEQAVANDPNANGSSKYVPQDNFLTAKVTPTATASFGVSVKAWRVVASDTAYEYPGTGESGYSLTTLAPNAGNKRFIGVFLQNDYKTLEAFGSTEVPLEDVPLGEDDVTEILSLCTTGSTLLAVINAYGQSTIAAFDINDWRQAINTKEGSGGGGGNTTATYLLQVADAGLPNAQAMGALTTGLVKNTTTTGVQSIATPGTDYTTPTGAENLSNKTITSPVINTGVSGSAIDNDPTLAANSSTLLATQQAVKTYVDTVAQGLDAKESVIVATATALPANTYSNGSSGVGATITGNSTGVLTVDGHTVALNERVLVKDESTQSHNGIYKCTTAGAVGVAFVLTRSLDANSSDELLGAYVFVEMGTTNASNGYVCTNASAITIGTTAITFTQFSGAGQIIPGTGLTKTGNSLAIDSTVATLAGTQTLTNKTIGSATNHIDGAAIDSGTVPVARLPIMVASGASHAAGLVPDPGSVAGATNYLREDGTWNTPSGTGASASEPYVTTATTSGLSNETAIPGLIASADIAGAAGGSSISTEWDSSGDTSGYSWSAGSPTANANTTIKSHLYLANLADTTERFYTRSWSPTGAAAFDARAKLIMGSNTASSAAAFGFLITSSSHTNRVLMHITQNNASYDIRALSYSGAWSQRGSTWVIGVNECYFRITRDGSNNVTYYWSANGILWQLVATISFTFTVANIGFYFVSNSGALIFGACDWLRTDV